MPRRQVFPTSIGPDFSHAANSSHTSRMLSSPHRTSERPSDSAISVSSVTLPAATRSQPPPVILRWMPNRAAISPLVMNSTVAPRASPMAKPRKAASARSSRLKGDIPNMSFSKIAGGQLVFSSDDQIFAFAFQRMGRQQRIEKRHLGDRHPDGEDRVPEAVRDVAI